MSSAFPLSWPEGWPRTSTTRSSQFKTGISGALKNVQKSVELFSKDSGKKVENVLISSNVTLGQQNPKDAGVAVYFSWDGISTCIAVDRYKKVEENLQAIHHIIEAERTKLRHGGLNVVRAAFRGYAALPPPGAEDDMSWWVVLDCDQEDTWELITERYRKLRSKYHTDRPNGTGDAEKFQAVISAYERAKMEREID